ncbi:MAG: carbamoyltransferase [Candidatus Omnitrophica bacterium]|nr:carbamoyltransferase [Candidatus Omnitrophota bacterium]MDD5077605.1 carbamoyltransferase [Candidatus Omnitrophota bacterium]
MNILGISCFYHDAAACLLQDGKITAAASEERFNRRKNSPLFPINAVNFCLQRGGLTAGEIDYVGFYEQPYLKFYRVLLSHLRAYPFSFKNFLATMPDWLRERLTLPLLLKNELGYEGEVFFIKHHLSHAASAFLVSPFEEAAILTADGVGEWATMALGAGKAGQIRMIKESHFPDSLGLFYTAITTYLGFEALNGEGKVMGLAGYGEPVYLEKLKEMVSVKPDGSLRLDQSFFGFNKGSRMYSGKLVRALGKERAPESKIEQRHCDIASSLQKFTEDVLIKAANNLYRETRLDKLCLAGGLFLNCLANNKILEHTPFKEIFVQPAAGDSGGALGVASYIYHSLLGKERNYVMEDACLGPDFSRTRIRRALVNAGINFREMEDGDLFKYAAGLILQDKIVGWFQGQMEFGPRALGNRSLLANPCNPGMKDILNSKVKKREPFRPYAPVVLEERADEFFRIKQPSPFMLIAGSVREEKAAVIPAVTHVDKTARVQTLSRKANPRLWQLIKEFEQLTGIPLLINTSFNLRGEPIVCTPEDAVSCFKRSRMDCLILDNCIAER